MDLYHENSGYKLQEYRLLLYKEMGVEISEAQLCTIFQTLKLTLKKPTVYRYEKFYNRDGACLIFIWKHNFCENQQIWLSTGSPNHANIDYYLSWMRFMASLDFDHLVMFDESAVVPRFKFSLQSIPVQTHTPLLYLFVSIQWRQHEVDKMRAPIGQPAYVWAFNPPYYRISVNGLCNAAPWRPSPLFWNAVNQTTSAQDLLDFFGDAIVSHSSTSVSHFNRF